MQLADQNKTDSLTPKLEEFVPSSLKRFFSIDIRENWDKPFGEVLAQLGFGLPYQGI